ncbi:Arylamine N-acetyltransferase, partial [Termitomyces sp. T112]
MSDHHGTLTGGLTIKHSSSAYSPRQITHWLSSISFPYPVSDDDIAQGRFPTTLENLTLINRLFLVSVPYENTMMHYSANHAMDISTESLYHRIAIERQGSYCFGLNIFFFQMLCGLGYRAYTGSARVNLTQDPLDAPVYTALSHMIIFVQPQSGKTTYLVDVGCGGSGPARPILLSSQEDNVVMGTTPTEQHRLTRGVRSDSRVARIEWRLNVRHVKDDGARAHWRVVYAFS